MQRRGFLRLAAAGAVLGITRYAEPFISIPDAGADWIEDRGSFYIIRVPDFKEFAGEVLDKPTIFLLGEKAVVRQVDVRGFVNLQAPKGGGMWDSRIDASRVEVGRNRPVLEIAKPGGFVLCGCHLIGSGVTGLVVA